MAIEKRKEMYKIERIKENKYRMNEFGMKKEMTERSKERKKRE